MNERIPELRGEAKACEAALLKALTSGEAGDAPGKFVGVVGELKATAAREDGRRMSLETLEPLLDEGRAFDERLDALEDKRRERRKELQSLAAPLAKRALQALRRGELPQEEAFQPLIETANHIADLRRRIEGSEEGEGFWARGKARAEKLVNQGKLKVAQFKLHGGLKDRGKAILKAGDEARLRCERTEEELEKVAAARAALKEVRDELESTQNRQSDFLKDAARRLGAETFEATSDIGALRKTWTEELERHREARELLETRILGMAMDDIGPDSEMREIAACRDARTRLDAASRTSVQELENVDWPAIQLVLGESASRCPGEPGYLRGIAAFDAFARKDNRKLGLEVCERGLAFCLPAAGRQPFVGLADESIVSLELEDMQQIYEMRRGNVVADSLIGFVTGGVKGAVMRGATGMREREVPVEMPDLVLTVVHRDFNGVEQAVHLAVEFDDKEAVAAHLSRHYAGRFRTVAKGG